MRSRLETALCREISRETGLPLSEVRKIVDSYFGVITSYARKLPFDNPGRIYKRAKFDSFVDVWNIPYIGRIGPVYSRYLKWRENVSKDLEQEPRSKYRSRITQSDIENMAEDILSGRTPSPVNKKKGNELYTRVWLVDTDGKKLAGQVIPKK